MMVSNYYRSTTAGGVDNFIRQERDLLCCAGPEVVRCTKRNDDVNEHEAAELLRTAASMSWSSRSHAEVSGLLRDARADFAHLRSAFPLSDVGEYAACRAHGFPVVQTLHKNRAVGLVATFVRDVQVLEQWTAGTPWPAVRHGLYRDSLLTSSAMA
jgi:hypothetical protein